MISVIILCVASCNRAGSGNGADGTPDFTEDEAARDNAGLRLYSALDPNESKIYFSEYQKETGVRIQWVRMSSGAILARLMAEKSNPAMGLWFGGSSTDFISAAEKGLLEPYRPETDFALPPQAHDPGWLWTGFYFGALGFASNENRLKRIGAAPPQSWKDLLKPEFRGEIGMAYPYTSGTSFTALSTLIQMMGEKKGFDYIRALDRNIHHYNKSGSACVTQVGLGEVAVGIAFSHDILKKGPAAGYPVTLTFPEEGTGYETGAMALIKGGPDHEEARQFINWALSKKAQSLMKQWYRIPLNPSAEVADGAVSADKLKLIEDDAIWAGRNKAALIEKWRLITAK